MDQKTNNNFNEERFRLALHGANDGLWDWDLETDEVYYSPRWKSMLGYEEDELPNDFDTWANLVHPDEKNAILGKVREYLSGKSQSFEAEMMMKHKDGHYIHVLSRAFSQVRETDSKPIRLIGTHVDISARKKAEAFNRKTAKILELIALGKPTSEIYDAIALLYESKHPGMRCSMLELSNGKLLHGGAPSLPKAYCDAVHGLKNGPNVGSCGASSYTGERCIVENIETHPNWADIKDVALPHGMRSCWSEPIKNSKGEVLGAFGMYYNYPALPNEDESDDLKSAARLAGIVMERDHDQKRMRELAYVDSLTGLASRAHFYQHVEGLIKTSKRFHHQFSLLYIDLDNFKNVNDSLGHDAGDMLLKDVAQKLKQVCREVDYVSRLSGDEFCIVVEEVKDAYTSSNMAERCFEALSQPMNLLGRQHSTTCSIGIAHFPDNGETLADLLKAADTALYSAKDLGKNRFAFYEPELTEKAEYRYLFEQLLKEAIENEEVTLVYQPQIDVSTGKVTGVEALARWFHPELGHVSPLEFVATVERIGLIKPFTEWVLKTACQQAVEWRNDGLPAIRIAVNVSPNHFLDPELVNSVQRVIDETETMPHLLELEVTENVVQTDINNLVVFNEIKRLGTKISIDDFGTGFSSFASLKHLDIDSLKIDRYFVNDMISDRDTKMLISSIIGIGHNLGHEIIAEGVETREQFAALQELSCDKAQGFFLCKPEEPQKIADLLKHGLQIPGINFSGQTA